MVIDATKMGAGISPYAEEERQCLGTWQSTPSRAVLIEAIVGAKCIVVDRGVLVAVPLHFLPQLPLQYLVFPLQRPASDSTPSSPGTKNSRSYITHSLLLTLRSLSKQALSDYQHPDQLT